MPADREDVNAVQQMTLAKSLPEVLKLLQTSGLSDDENTAWSFYLTKAFQPPKEQRRKAYRLDMLLEKFDAFSEKIDHAGRTGELIGPITGFPRLDQELCGALYPGLHVVAGNTGAGKTAFALQVACQCGFPALYVTCEMSALELYRRLAARVSSNQLHKFKNPKTCLPAATMKAAARAAAEAVPNLVVADSTMALWDKAAIIEQARQMKQIANSEHILIVIDSLHSWAAWLDADEYDRLNVALKSLRTMAAELECPVLYIAEQSKTANRENSRGRDMGSSAPAGFRGIEYGAETVIGLLTAVDSGTGEPIKDVYGCQDVTLRLHKNRNGSPGKPIKFTFDGALQKFEEEGE